MESDNAGATYASGAAPPATINSKTTEMIWMRFNVFMKGLPL